MGHFEFVIREGPDQGKVYAFPSSHFFVGSGEECLLQFRGGELRAKHAEIWVDLRGVAWARDLTGEQLLWLNGNVTEEGEMSPGSLVRLGHLELLMRRAFSHEETSGAQPAPAPLQLNTAFLAPPGSSTPHPSLDVTSPRMPRPGEETIPHVDTPSSMLALGTVIDGRYEVMSKIAAGGMGEVYRAQHVELGKVMALKVMLPELSNDPEFVARFKREAIAASRIGQQNIVDISDFGRTAAGRFYFVMEYIDGVTLSHLLNREGAQQTERVLNIFAQTARALASAHAQGIVHRDLKPDNIMLVQRPGQADFVKVLDFGVAKVSQGHGQGGHTAVGLVVGTPQYMSPEQAKAVPVDARSDIYSMGLIMYELLTGRPTFAAETPSMLMVKHVTEPPPPFEPGPLAQLPEELEALVFSMLEKEPDARPQTMEDVLVPLELLWARYRAKDPTLTRPSKRSKAAHKQHASTSAVKGPISGKRRAVSRSKWPLILGSIVVIIAIAVAYVPTNPEPERVVETPVSTAEILKPVEKVPVEPVQAPPVTKVRLTFTSIPEAIDVFEGDVLLGATPLSIERDSTTSAELTFEANGHIPFVQKVIFDVERTIPIVLQKEKRVVPPVLKKRKQGLVNEPRSKEEDLKDLPF